MTTLRMLLVVVPLLAAASWHQAAAQCPPPCGARPAAGCPIAVGAGTCTYSSFMDTKGGLWCYVCTNVPGGNYEWWYDEAGAKPNKVVGRCVFKGGSNNHGYVTEEGDPDQRIIYWHYVIDGNDNKHVVVHIFFKDPNIGFEFELQYNNVTDQWDTIDRRQYESLDAPVPLPIPATYSVNLELVAAPVPSDPTVIDIKWAAPDPEPTPVLTPGDSVFLLDIALEDVLGVDPRFSVAAAPPTGSPGVILTAEVSTPLLTGDYLATIRRPVQPAVVYAVRDLGAEQFYMNVFNGAPLDHSWSSRLDLADMVGYVAASGEMDIPVAPPNDDCTNAIAILEGIFPYSNVGANTDGPSPCGTMGSDIWYLYTACNNGVATATTCSANRTYDTVLAVYNSPCVGSLVGCNDDGPPFCANPSVPFSGSTVAFPTVAGQQYLIQVGGFAGAQGASDLTITHDNCAPQNGACCCGSSCTNVANAALCTPPGAFPVTFIAGGNCSPFSVTTPCCRADFNRTGNPPTSQDIFDFLASFFSTNAAIRTCADLNGNPPSAAGVSSQDIFDFLAAFFRPGGCAP